MNLEILFTNLKVTKHLYTLDDFLLLVVMKAVIPAAGLGTRFLPATKAQPKEMLPVVDRPTIQFVVEEAMDSGIENILIITGKGKRSIEDHFDRAIELETMLGKEYTDSQDLESLRNIIEKTKIFYIRQKEPKGLGHAVLCAKEHVGNEPFAVMLGDDITLNRSPCTQQLIDVHNKYKSSVIAVERLPKERIVNYGAVKLEPIDVSGATFSGKVYRILDIIEKPEPDKIPSDLAVIGRYILTPAIFDCLENVKPGLKGELQLTDAIKILMETEDVYAYEFHGRRFDIGNKIDWIKAIVTLSLERDNLGDELRSFLKNII
jgi:UTP--glucose-1-phosphate uridylyltransferase